MNAALDLTPAAAVEGGYYIARMRPQGRAPYGLIVAPKALGEHAPIEWNASMERVKDAQSYHDGRANTIAMAKAGSRLAEWALDLTIDGVTGFYLGALDELEVAYRHLKPGTTPNSLWSRSGINVSADPSTYPYTEDDPAQTGIALFQAGGSEAFEGGPYWTSTQHALDGDCAWGQYFDHGTQDDWSKNGKLRVRVFRRLVL